LTDLNQSKKPNAWALASEGTQLAVTLLLCFYLGYKVDEWKGTQPWFTLSGAVVGMTVGLYNFLRRFLTKKQ
jgi:F0F1-type ATP synthase assembly protein I